MLTLEGIRRTARGLPAIVQLGLATMAFALLVDVMAHLEATAPTGQAHQHTSTEVWAHVGVLVGMVLIIWGVIVDGVRQRRARRASAAEHRSKGVA
jgi:hypothetical protein